MIKKLNIITDIELPGLKLFKKGKVRNVYDMGSSLLIVASDRISAFDFILPNGIPDKGATLTAISKFWFEKLENIMENHIISYDVKDYPEETKPYHDILDGRSMLVKKAELIEIECVVRGYIVGSGWKEYQQSGTVCGEKLPAGLKQAEILPEPIFTPAKKATTGHDENISISVMRDIIGNELTNTLIEKSMAIYNYGREFANQKNIILADTKFEFGIYDGKVILIDEVLTPDSSRYWPKSSYQIGMSPPSFDKQIIRDYLEKSGWDKQPPAPKLPEEIIVKAANKYKEIYGLLTQ